MITETAIREAYIFLRQHNTSIPDEVLDFIKDAALEKLQISAVCGEIEALIEKRYNGFRGGLFGPLRHMQEFVRKHMGDKDYLDYLEKLEVKNPRPVYTAPEAIKDLISQKHP